MTLKFAIIAIIIVVTRAQSPSNENFQDEARHAITYRRVDPSPQIISYNTPIIHYQPPPNNHAYVAIPVEEAYDTVSITPKYRPTLAETKYAPLPISLYTQSPGEKLEQTFDNLRKYGAALFVKKPEPEEKKIEVDRGAKKYETVTETYEADTIRKFEAAPTVRSLETDSTLRKFEAAPTVRTFAIDSTLRKFEGDSTESKFVPDSSVRKYESDSNTKKYETDSSVRVRNYEDNSATRQYVAAPILRKYETASVVRKYEPEPRKYEPNQYDQVQFLNRYEQIEEDEDILVTKYNSDPILKKYEAPPLVVRKYEPVPVTQKYEPLPITRKYEPIPVVRKYESTSFPKKSEPTPFIKKYDQPLYVTKYEPPPRKYEARQTRHYELAPIVTKYDSRLDDTKYTPPPLIVKYAEPPYVTKYEHDDFERKSDNQETTTPANYEFEYSVHDPNTGDAKTQKETRTGDKVEGSYSFVDADGTKHTVDYTADARSGFNAVIRKEPANLPVPFKSVTVRPQTKSYRHETDLEEPVPYNTRGYYK